jgi:hypothetical protein
MTRSFLAFPAVMLALTAAASAADFDRAKQARPAAHAACHASGRADFSVSTGDDLRAVMARWSQASGWTLVWHSDYAFQIAGSARFSGGFVDAVGALMAAMQEARPSPVADIYRENCVVVVKDGLSANR